MKAIRYLLLCLAALLVFVPGEASAQSQADKTTARALGVEGQEALEAKEYEKAADRFRRAEQLYHAPTLVLGLARAYVGMGKFVEAMESYNSIIREKQAANASDAFKQAVEDAKSEVEGLDAKIGWVTIQVEGPDNPNVTIDGEAVSTASLGVRRATNPGTHEVKAGAEGFKTAALTIEVDAGASETVTLRLEPGEGEPPDGDGGVSTDDGNTLQLVGFIALGVGAAGLIVGAITGGLAIGKHGELEDNCNDNSCPPEQQDNLDSFETMGLISTIGFIAGGVLAAGGAVLVIVTSLGDDGEEQAEAPTLTTELGIGRVSATLRF